MSALRRSRGGGKGDIPDRAGGVLGRGLNDLAVLDRLLNLEYRKRHRDRQKDGRVRELKAGADAAKGNGRPLGSRAGAHGGTSNTYRRPKPKTMPRGSVSGSLPGAARKRSGLKDIGSA